MMKELSKTFQRQIGWVKAKMGTMKPFASLLLFPVVFTLRWT